MRFYFFGFGQVRALWPRPVTFSVSGRPPRGCYKGARTAKRAKTADAAYLRISNFHVINTVERFESRPAHQSDLLAYSHAPPDRDPSTPPWGDPRGGSPPMDDASMTASAGGRRWFGAQCPGLGPGASPVDPMACCTSSGSRRKISCIAS